MAASSPNPANTGDSQQHDSQIAAEATVQQTSTTLQADDSATASASTPATTSATDTIKPEATQPKLSVDEDDESDFDELDEVLDDFKPKAQAPTDATASKPSAAGAAAATPKIPEDLDELAFMNQLEQDMAKMMSQAAQQSGVSDSEGFESAINQGADAFTKQLEESGIPPGDFIKQLLADVMAEEAEEKGQGSSSAPASSTASASASTSAAAEAGSESFNDAIQRTINRMKESGDKATAAASEDNTDDLVAQLLKAIEAGSDGVGDDGDLTKIFMGMMEQLSNKDMLYEPMKELDTKFGPWIKDNRGEGKVSDADMERYEKQAALVSQIVAKFEEPGYTDEDAKCREYVWEKMQAMQAAGNPPDELVANPWMDDFKGGGVPDCPQQ
ncbi:Putative Microbody (Peroxisome) biogenesis protein peroxin 19 (Eurofung) [Aspergillus calidoustus]|uniref:Putative Microbody (Peroxisome) biogenesis protein peroxin 19 (Eurofung) n=1 Tax=Aspergillus calidoustus TaxID=454130 RepID=A0A0U5G9Q9_ASPCI|nr:Putative Microbody (Peroxisome) biogenesis protein peroxin 19 (Eurofung) [Aspergillus calidoustus]